MTHDTPSRHVLTARVTPSPLAIGPGRTDTTEMPRFTDEPHTGRQAATVHLTVQTRRRRPDAPLPARVAAATIPDPTTRPRRQPPAPHTCRVERYVVILAMLGGVLGGTLATTVMFYLIPLVYGG